MYHGIATKPLPLYNWCQVSVEEFDRQLDFLSRNYRAMPLSEVVLRLRNGLQIPSRALCLTFDDGFRSVLTTALPILEKYDLPATVFVVTGLMDSGEPPWPEQLYLAISNTSVPTLEIDGRRLDMRTTEERATAYEWLLLRAKALPAREKSLFVDHLLFRLGTVDAGPEASSTSATLTWDEVEILRRSGLVEIGLHTHTHQILSRCSPAEQRSELEISTHLARKHWGGVDLFAYPNGQPGDYSSSTKHLLREMGFRCALTTIHGLNDRRSDLYELRRVGIGRGAPLWSVKKRLSVY